MSGTTIFAFFGGTAESAPLSGKILYHISLALSFVCLWTIFKQLIQSSRPVGTQIFWQLSVAILITWIILFLISLIQGDFLDFNIPAAPIVHVKSALFSVLLAGLSFFLVQRLGLLVRYRRTRGGERNWRLLLISVCLIFIAVSPLHHHFSIGSDPLVRIRLFGSDLSLSLEVLVIIPALLILATLIVLIILNIIRLGWVFRLSITEKISTIGLGAMVILMTAGTLLILFRPDVVSKVTLFSEFADLIQYLLFYSLPLTMVIGLSMIFGFVYALTSVLSLIFHLPTTGDYRRTVDEMAAIQALADLFHEVAGAEKVYQWIVSTPIESGRGKAAWLCIQDVESGSLKPQIVAAHNIESSLVDQHCDVTAIYDEATRTRELVYIQNTSYDRRISESESCGILSLLAIPLLTSTEVLGTLFVTHDLALAFEKEDVESIGIFASQATVVLENARLLEAKIERERLSSELAIAREVQQRLLPQSMPILPHLSLAASSTAANEVGGDYYDLIELGDGKLAFIIADVSGKGTSAAFYMAEMQGIFQAVTRIAPDPNDFLHHANQALGQSLEKNVFVTTIYGIMDSDSGQISMSRAGHCPAVYLDVNGKVKLLRSGGLGIGLNQGPLFTETMEVEKLIFNPGDLMVLYTDGVVECRNSDGVEFGYDRLIQGIQSARFERAQGVHDAIIQTVSRFMGSEKNYDDDLTLLVLKWHGREPVIHSSSPGPPL